ncbi:MAG: transposase [Polyangiaceae bacterium]|nr:transposase [Polyangiaceae bacterium]
MGTGECAVVVQGFNVYAGDAIDGRDRKRVERMCRYLARPPIATVRLTEVGTDLRYELKKAWRDGTRFVTLEPYELIARICAMVPPPRLHMIRFHGVLAPNSALREQVVASARPYVPPNVDAPPDPVQLALFGEHFEKDEAEQTHARRKPWAWLLRHVFAVDVNVCPECAGPMKWRQVALTPHAIREGLARAGLWARGLPKRKRVPLGQLVLPFPKMRRA